MLAEHIVRVSNENFVPGSFIEYEMEKLDNNGSPIENTAAKLIFSDSGNFLYSGFPFLLNDEVDENGWPILPILRGIGYLAAIAAAAYDAYCDNLIKNGVNNCSGCATVGNCEVNCDPNPC
jgi:hypothetical protein